MARCREEELIYDTGWVLYWIGAPTIVARLSLSGVLRSLLLLMMAPIAAKMVFFAVFFTFNFFFELFLARNRCAYVFGLLGIVDFVTIVPIFVAMGTGNLKNSPTGFVRFYRLLVLSRVFKPFRLLRVVEALSPGNDAVLEQMARAMAYFVSTLFLASGMVMVLSEGRTEEWGDVSSVSGRPMNFHDALYFIIVTFSTVGYGDISPPDSQSRLAIVLLIGFFFFMIPRELNKLNQLLDLSSKYAGPYPKNLAHGHTIVGCDISACGLVAAFLEEFFHEDHGYNITHMVLLVPHEPTMEWKRLVLNFAANDRVMYLKGDVRNSADLSRVSAHTASSCFILSNRHGNLREEEKRSFMRAISVQDFNPNIHIYVAALTVEMRQRLVKVGINPKRIVCTSTINTRLLANACMWEGASTLVTNLLVSASIDEDQDVPAWVKEYAVGLGKEIYVVSIGALAGRGFSELVQHMFEQHGVILLGISEDHRVVLHPGAGYIVSQGDCGFLIADDADVAQSIIEKANALLCAAPPRGGQGRADTLTSAASIAVAMVKESAAAAAAASATAGVGGEARAGMIPNRGYDSAGPRPRPPPPRDGSNRGSGIGGGSPSLTFPRDPAEVATAAATVGLDGEGFVSAKRHAKGGGNVLGDVGCCPHTPPPLSPPQPPPTITSCERRLAREEKSAAASPARIGGNDREVDGSGAAISDEGSAYSRSGGDTGATISEGTSGASCRGESGSGCGASRVDGITGAGGASAGVVTGGGTSGVARGVGRGASGSFGGGYEAGYIVLITPTLSQLSALVEALEAPQVPRTGIVVVCPLHEWSQEQDEDEMQRLRAFPQVSLVVGSVNKRALRAAGAKGARIIVVRAGKSFPGQKASDADAETIGHLVEVTAAVGPYAPAIVELHDMTYGDHYEILVDLLRSSSPPGKGGQYYPSGAAADSSKGPAAPVGVSLSAASPRGVGGIGANYGSPDNSRLTGTRHALSAAPARRGDEGDGMIVKKRWTGRNRVGRSSSSGLGNQTVLKGVASGAVVPNNLPETLLCQAFYNPAIIMIVEALLDPRAPGYGSSVDGYDDDGEGGAGSSGRARGGGHDDGGVEGGGTSFLAQLSPPKKFFTEAMLSGDRPNFQALMRFMLREYDALPFGLLRNCGSEGHLFASREASREGEEEAPTFVSCCPSPHQKVVPLDKVFLLAPNLESWERMKLDSPLTARPATHYPGGLTPPRDTSPSRSQLSFRPKLGNRGSTVHPIQRTPHRRKTGGDAGDAGRPESPCAMDDAGGGAQPRPRKLFPAPFNCAVEADEVATEAPTSDAWVSSPGRSGGRYGLQHAVRAPRTLRKSESVFGGGRGGGLGLQERGGRLEVGQVSGPASPQKGSHAKLDLVLNEVQRLNGRLDAIVDRLGELEEEKDEMRRGRDTAT